MEKYKRGDIVGIERENERDENYKSTSNPQIDKSRTHLNYHTLPYEKKYLVFIDERIKELAPKRKIKDDAVLITSFILGSDKEFFDGISTGTVTIKTVVPTEKKRWRFSHVSDSQAEFVGGVRGFGR